MSRYVSISSWHSTLIQADGSFTGLVAPEPPFRDRPPPAIGLLGLNDRLGSNQPSKRNAWSHGRSPPAIGPVSAHYIPLGVAPSAFKEYIP